MENGTRGRSPALADGAKALYTVTRYNMAENKGLTVIYLRDMSTGEEKALTDNTSNNSSPRWSADAERIYFVSNRSGSAQVWSMAADGSDARRVTDIEGGVEGYGVRRQASESSM